MTERSAVLGVCQNQDAARGILRELRRKRLRCCAAIRKAPDGRITVEAGEAPLRHGTLLGAAAGFLCGLLLGVTPTILAVMVAAAAAGASLLARRFARGVDDRLLAELRRLVLQGESLIIVEARTSVAGKALALLREAGDDVATFIMRPASPGTWEPRAEPLRREAFNPERLGVHAARTAMEHELTLTRRRAHSLLAHLEQSQRSLERVRRELAQAARTEQGLASGAEWLLDNAYLIQGQIGEIFHNLPKSYYEELPSVAHGPRAGVPRVYAIAAELIAHTDAKLDLDSIVSFLRAYQEIAALTIGELWAMPLMLRLGLVESLRHLALKIYRLQRQHEQADFWANRLLNASRRDPDQLLFILAELAREHTRPDPSFAVRLVGHLHDEAAALVPLQAWLERKLDIALPEILQQEQSRQAADQVSIANAVGSLRSLTRLQWQEVFERLSLVEHVLRTDPTGVYAAMDFATRDRYRHAIEETAKWSRSAEIEAARRAIALARAAEEDGRMNHVGFYLIDAGREALERALACRPPLRRRILRCVLRHSTPVYLGTICLLTAGVVAAALTLALTADANPAAIALLGALAVLPASELAVQAANRLVTTLLPPSTLPRMSFAEGLPEDCHTLVVVPMMLLSAGAVQGEVDRLEIRYLANPDGNLRYALLADFSDAPAAVLPDDAALLSVARQGIERLNKRYGDDRFYLFCRARRWSESEQRWIGWERKRGKLEELNRYLCDGPDAGGHDFLHAGCAEALLGTRYVITLDSDTQLPSGSARRLVETIAHPLTQARLGPDGRTVAHGYTIIQPRVCTSLPSATASRFTRLYADATGMDPYCHAISDVYQDLVKEGTFFGKGLYDLRTFHHMLSGRFPEATILSHDLLEGAYVRVGLATEIELLDLYPASYQAYAKRQHRWIRGDWQIADWVLPRVGGEPNPLSLMNRWKILDNLRRSLVPTASLLLLVAGWPVGPPILWTLLGTLHLFFPAIAKLIPTLARSIDDGRADWREMGIRAAKGLLSLALLPHQAALALDAILRVWYRRLISHRQLLEWETAQVTHIRWRSGAHDPSFLVQVTLASLAVALVAAGTALRGQSLSIALPFLFAWALAPLATWWLNAGPPRPAYPSLSPKDRRILREVARLTWRYFDDFVDDRSNWLPPDNYQEALKIEVAQRTSPTNIAMYMLSALAARDLGYLTTAELVERLGATYRTITRLELHEGHLLNWYDTQTLEPLRPRYISTVDSGNLLASLWALGQGCQRLATEPLLGAEALDGLHDVVCILLGDARRHPANDGLDTLAALAAPLAEGTGRLDEIDRRLRLAAGLARELVSALRADGQPEESLYWAGQLAKGLSARVAESERYLPWVPLLAARTEEEFAALDAEIPAAWHRALTSAPSLRELCEEDSAVAALVRALRAQAANLPPALAAWLPELEDAHARAREHAGQLLSDLMEVSAGLARLADGMDMKFLYDRERRLFAVGYDQSERRLDSSYYDLLASEARLASFVAIARGDVLPEHWAALGRPFGTTGRQIALLSWNGTMFEYLMPLLLSRSFACSLLDLACRAAVVSQTEYGAKRGIPWGVSEAAFSGLDSHQIYQYRAFGVPWLGLKHGLEDDLVVAPYATALALAIDPAAATANLRRLAALGMRGRYGYYEAIDYARQRRPEGERGVIIYAYMAHHQGMTLVAMDNALNDGIMQARFHADPRVRASEPLLFERLPAEPPFTYAPGGEGPPPRLTPVSAARATSHYLSPNTPSPRTHLLSNGTLTVMVTNAGGGYSQWRELEITRWRADATRDAWGSFCYIRDLDLGAVWSTAFHPLGQAGRRYAAKFTVDRAEFRRRDFGIETATEIVVSPEDDAEIRRITLVNRSMQTRRLELTSYAELTLAPHQADRAHPAFSRLFIQTEALPERDALLAWRRRRSPAEPSVWAGHVVAVDARHGQVCEYETDRARFLGRARSPRDPAALAAPLSGTTGYVLDPIFSLRCRVSLEPGHSVKVAFVTTVAESRQGVMTQIEKYGSLASVDAAVEMAWAHAQLEMRHLGIHAEDAQHFQELGGHMLYPNARIRAASERLRRNNLDRTRLWAYGVSGDLPILTVTVDDRKGLNLVREVLVAHTYLRLKGLRADLVILNGESVTYGQPLHEDLKRLILAHSMHTGLDQPGGVFLRAIAQMPEEDLTLFLASARVALVAARGTLAQQLGAHGGPGELPPRLKANKRLAEEPSAPLPFLELPFFNGLGGFTPDGREYAIYLGPGQWTPAPWVNVMASPECGALVSEAGAGFAWCANSQTNRLTPWSNDPVADPVADTIYLRDEDTGVFWSPTAQPIREHDAYRARHGQGYTVFEHNSHAIDQELLTYVPVGAASAPVRIHRLRLRNRSSRRRRLSVTAYAEWTLGVDREETQLHVVTKWDPQSQALLARNAYHPEYATRIAFAALGPPADSFTADRTEFLGRNGSAASPAALDRQSLSGRTGAGLDPCTAQQVTVELDPGKTAEVTVVLGQCAEIEEVRRLVKLFRDPLHVEESWRGTRDWWDRLLGTVQIHTPDLALDMLVNRWLLYQTLSCRIWARSAFYQSGGALGFRDQLQDALALVHTCPAIARGQILAAAGRQFVEGDVQHWWHPPSGAGTRTRCADDLLWLPYATAHYVSTTGDLGILDERVPYIEGRPLAAHEQDAYLVPSPAMEDGSLFSHCRRAIEKGLTTGPHGLPLIGSGDWNDGLNRVGCAGQGESVWLAWFLVEVLTVFAELCTRYGEEALAESYRHRAGELVRSIEARAWDGQWYRRAYFDDGTPLGSRENQEARIDSLPQSWAAITGRAEPSRVEQALRAADEHLVRWRDGLVALFSPPFDESPLDPGYVKGYPPGVRENGGQYTHAAIWLALAHARRGDGDQAVALLRLLNPIERTHTPPDVERYKVEPYVLSADVHTLPGRVGQGGWTWYTGSSGWFYRVLLEEILGFKRAGDKLTIAPVLPSDWGQYTIEYRHGETRYEITVENPERVSGGVTWVELDGDPLADGTIPLRDDGATHTVRVTLGKTERVAAALP